MKKFFLIGCSVCLIFLVSCKSAPKNGDGKNSFAPDANSFAATGADSELVAANESSLQGASSAREAAISAGAESLGNSFSSTEKKFDDIKENISKKDMTGELGDIEKRYKALENYANAVAAKKRIDEEDLSGFAPNEYQKGVDTLSGLDSMFADENVSGDALVASSLEAAQSFTKVLNFAYRQRAVEARKEAIAAKKEADSIFAGTAAKDEYAKNVGLLTKGDSNFVTQNAVAAYDNYVAATEGFLELHVNVMHLRAEALAAMEEAKKRVAESASYAASADTFAPITDENQEGIEAADAVLVEMETFADPNEAAVDLPDLIDEM